MDLIRFKVHNYAYNYHLKDNCSKILNHITSRISFPAPLYVCNR